MVDSANGPVKGGPRPAGRLKPRQPYPFDTPRARRSSLDNDEGSDDRPCGRDSRSAGSPDANSGRTPGKATAGKSTTKPSTKGSNRPPANNGNPPF